MVDDDLLSAAEQLAAIGQAVITTDPGGVIVYWNEAAEQLYGWTAQEALGRNVAEVTVAEVGQDVAAEIMAALRDGVPWSGGFPVRRKDGSTFPALVTDAGIYRDGPAGRHHRGVHQPRARRSGRSSSARPTRRCCCATTRSSPMPARPWSCCSAGSRTRSSAPRWSTCCTPTTGPPSAQLLDDVVARPGRAPAGRGAGAGLPRLAVGRGRVHQPARRPHRARSRVQPAPQPGARGDGAGRGAGPPARDRAADPARHRARQGLPRGS